MAYAVAIEIATEEEVIVTPSIMATTGAVSVVISVEAMVVLPMEDKAELDGQYRRRTVPP
jgi:hypothetical protein